MSNIFVLIKKLYYNEYLVILFVVLMALFVRLYKIDSPIADWHSFRQADTASVTREYVRNGINIFIPRYHDLSRVQSGIFNPNGYRFVEFPIFNAVHALAFKYVGLFNLELWGRLLSVIYTLIAGLFIYFTGKILYNRWFGLLTLFIFYFLPFNIYFTRVILPEPMAVMFGVAALYFFVKYTKVKLYKFLVVSSFFMLLGILVKPYIVFYSLPIVFYFVNNFGVKQSLKKKETMVYLLLVFIPFFAWRVWMKRFPEGIPFWQWTFNGDGIRFNPAFWYWIFGQRLGNLILGAGGVVPFGLGLVGLKKSDYFINGILLGAFLYVCTFATANVRHDYYQSIVIPAVSFLVAKGIFYVWKNKEYSYYWSKFVVVIALLIGFLVSAFQVKEFYKINHPEIIAAGNAVDKLTPKDAIVIANYNGDTAFLYQTKRRGWPVVELPINELIEEGAQYYVSVNFDTQTNEFMNKFKIMEKTPTYVILDLTVKTDQL